MIIQELQDAYRDDFGEPDMLISAEPYFNGFIAISLPIEDEELYHTTIMTLGLSESFARLGIGRAEVMIGVELGDIDEKQLEPFAKEAARYLSEGLARGERFALRSIIPHHLSLLGQASLGYIDVYDGISSEWCGSDGTVVTLLQLTPILPEESEQLMSLHDADKSLVMKKNYFVCQDPCRSPQPLIANAVENTWSIIERWYASNAERAYQELQKGATDEELERLEDQLGMKLPLDYRASLKTHNGETYLRDGYQYLRASKVWMVWRSLKQLNDEGRLAWQPKASDGKLVDAWWSDGWIPFAEDSGGNLICMDVSPGPNGKAGQILYWEREEGPILAQKSVRGVVSEYHSYLDWLNVYLSLLQSKYYQVDEDGSICS